MPDQELVDKTIESINKGTKFISCLLNDVDSAGHANGHLPSNPKYIAAIDESEDYARKIIDAAKEQCKGDRRLNIIISTDHGGRYNGHGGTWLESRTT
ncbi:hypothetical protein FACS1894218_2040 [Bacilli bacterium]|nr:hypothetical protein FACS1894218_2040 [Bacilli bacterium]